MSADSSPALIYRLTQLIIRFFARIWFKVEIIGEDHIPKDGSAVIVCNHVSYLDPALIGGFIKKRIIRFLARESLLSSKWYGWYMKKLKLISLDRSRGDLRAFKIALKELKSGSLVGIFPEGTRSVDGTIQEAKGGVGFLIAKAKVTIIPAYMSGTYEALPKGRLIARPGKIQFIIGKPFRLEDLPMRDGAKVDYSKIGDIIMGEISKLNPKK